MGIFYRKYKSTVNLCLLFIFVLGFYFFTQPDRLRPSIETKIEIDSTLLRKSIQQITELSTLGFYYSEIGDFSEQKTLSLFGGEINIPGTRKSFLIVYDGEMKLGIDTGEMEIDIRDRIIIITLPEPKVLSHVVYEDSVQIYDESAGIFTRLSISDYTDFIAEQKQEKEDSLIGSSLLEQAAANAEEAIMGLLLVFPGVADEYTVLFD
ncbi:MAG: DUF4230 domain-containing protein [Lachnospiraceae bacterium]|nr:DUF4230 domain-containing protein [Lachnospiraceae bacterium]